MGGDRGTAATASPSAGDEPASAGKEPRTARGRRTLRAILDAAAVEFAGNGFHDSSISGITRRAGVALGSFYTYFNSKDEVFRALVRDMSDRVRDHVAPAIRRAQGGQIAAEQAALAAFIRFAREHKEIYRIIDEAEFVDPESFRMHYATTAERITKRLRAAAARGELRPDIGEIHAWALMGMNVFLGLRYSVWNEELSPDTIADAVGAILAQGISAEPGNAGE